MKLIARKHGSSASRRSRRYNTQGEIDRAVERWRGQGFDVFWVFDHEGTLVRHWRDTDSDDIAPAFRGMLNADKEPREVHKHQRFIDLLTEDLAQMFVIEKFHDYNLCYREWKRRIGGQRNFLAYAESLAAGKHNEEE